MQQADHSAPDSAAGVYFQLDRVLYRLATCTPDGIVGLETDDDITVVERGSVAILEQDKLSHGDVGHPFQDRSRGLWNSLNIWLEAFRADPARYKTAQLCLVTTRPVPATALVVRLAKPGKSAEDVKSCIAELRTIGADPSESLRALTTDVCAFSDGEIEAVLKQVTLIDGTQTADGASARRDAVGWLHHPPELDATAIAQALVGWLHDVVTAAWKAGDAAWVPRKALDGQLDAVIRHHRAVRTRERAERFVPVSELDRARAKSRPFVERMVEIELEEPTFRGSRALYRAKDPVGDSKRQSLELAHESA